MTDRANFLGELHRKADAGDWPHMLVDIANVVISFMHTPATHFLVLDSPALDALCLRAGAMAMGPGQPKPAGTFDDGLVVHVATELYAGLGGHTQVLRDVVRAQPGKRHVVLLTNIEEAVTPDHLAAVFEGVEPRVEAELAPRSGDIAAKLLWLHARLAQLRPGRLMLFNHHYDAAAIAAAQPEAARETIYFHHADHQLALGVHLPHAHHVDCSNIVHHRCREVAGVRNQRYWPLVAQDLGVRPGGLDGFMAGGALRTCSHGSPNKFMKPASFTYAQVVKARLEAVPGEHVHVGGLPQDYAASIARDLEAGGIDPARLVVVPPVRSLWAFLRDGAIDLCFASYPVSGAKGIVETMGAGIPILIHENAASKQFSTRDVAYPEALNWTHPEEFVAALRGVDAALLARHSALARAHYERWHHPRVLERVVNDAGAAAEPPPLGPPRLDPFALYYR